MKSSAVPTIDRPRPFAVNELFFSTTESRGIITSGNEVFVRISGYAAGELVGKAHNLVRHPDMPRSAFRLVWDRLKAGQPAAALVKNRAKDGCYYWVVALITPTADGYLSVRFKPTGANLGVIEPLYAQMRAAEVAAEQGGADGEAAMDAGAAVLGAALQAHGWADYEEFMRVLLCGELQSRDAALAQGRLAIVQPLPADAQRRALREPVLKYLADIYRDGLLAYKHLDGLYHRLDQFVALNQTLSSKSAFVNTLTDELRLSSINVALASTRLGGEGESLGVISRHMDETSGEVAHSVHGLVTGINTVSGRLRGVNFNLAASRLQLEMALTFLHELLASDDLSAAWQERCGLIRTLHAAFTATMGQASQALHELEEAVHPLGAIADYLSRHMLTLLVTQVGGLVESTRLSSQGNFHDIFLSIREQIERTHKELAELTNALHQLAGLAVETPGLAREIVQAADRMGQDIATLPAEAVAPVVPVAATKPASPAESAVPAESEMAVAGV